MNLARNSAIKNGNYIKIEECILNYTKKKTEFKIFF